MKRTLPIALFFLAAGTSFAETRIAGRFEPKKLLSGLPLPAFDMPFDVPPIGASSAVPAAPRKQDGKTYATGKLSALQPIVEHHEAGPVRGVEDFIDSYEDCLKGARGLGISAVRPHPTKERTIIVYSRSDARTIADLEGVVEVDGGNETLRLRVETHRALGPRDLRGLEHAGRRDDSDVVLEDPEWMVGPNGVQP